MKVFDSTDGWEEKVNFVDENNVMLGYDMLQGCCETADWFISDKMFEPDCKDIPDSDSSVDLSDWRFDKTFCKNIELNRDNDVLESGEMVAFRIVNGEDEKFIHIYNCHNGYYSHGFEFKDGDAIIEDGAL